MISFDDPLLTVTHTDTCTLHLPCSSIRFLLFSKVGGGGRGRGKIRSLETQAACNQPTSPPFIVPHETLSPTFTHIYCTVDFATAATVIWVDSLGQEGPAGLCCGREKNLSYYVTTNTKRKRKIELRCSAVWCLQTSSVNRFHAGLYRSPGNSPVCVLIEMHVCQLFIAQPYLKLFFGCYLLHNPLRMPSGTVFLMDKEGVCVRVCTCVDLCVYWWASACRQKSFEGAFLTHWVVNTFS